MPSSETDVVRTCISVLFFWASPRKAVMAKLAKVRRKPYNAGEALRRSSTIIPGGGGRRDSTFSTNSAADQAMQMKSKPKDLMAWYANSFLSIALSGGFAVLPALGLGE